jgi:hypothetical protein
LYAALESSEEGSFAFEDFGLLISEFELPIATSEVLTPILFGENFADDPYLMIKKDDLLVKLGQVSAEHWRWMSKPPTGYTWEGA